jgi:hypothetical protein
MFFIEASFLKKDLEKKGQTLREALMKNIFEDILESFEAYEKLNSKVSDYEVNIKVIEKANTYYVKVYMLKHE